MINSKYYRTRNNFYHLSVLPFLFSLKALTTFKIEFGDVKTALNPLPVDIYIIL